MKIRKSTIIVHIVAWAFAVIWILPFLSVFMASIRPFREVSHGWWNFEEFNPTFMNYVEAWNHPNAPMSLGMRNSFIVAIPAIIIPMIVGSLAGYGFARFSFPTKDWIFLTVVLIMAVPAQMIAIPIFKMMSTLGLVDSLYSVILVQSAWSLGWIILVMRNFFSTLPIEVEEAAKVDGASDFKIFYKIVLPMTVPALVSVFVLGFSWIWNEFFLALILIYSPEKMLVTQRIPMMKGQYYVNWSVLSAASILTMMVPVLIFALLQKYYIRGMIGWTVKG